MAGHDCQKIGHEACTALPKRQMAEQMLKVFITKGLSMQIKQIISARKRRLVAAFSLVEVTISLGVVGTIAGAMLTGIMGGFFTMKMARENLRATQILLEKVETIRLYDWDQINTPNFIPALFTNSYDPQVVAADRGLNYTSSVAISSSP